jgi:succinoglycan biosynthesis transport protein ExoP
MASASAQNGIEPELNTDKLGGEQNGHQVPILLHYWNILWRRRLIVLGAVGLSLLAGAIATGMATPIYTAVTKIEISREQARVTNVEGLESERAGQAQEFYSTQYELLRSRTLAERVVRKLGLARSNEFFALHDVDVGGDGSTAAQVGLSPAEAKSREERAVALVQGNVEVQPVRGSALVTIGYSNPDPIWSAKVANTWASEFIQNSLDRRFASTSEARAFLEKRLDDLRQRLDQSEQQLVDYAVSRNIISIKQAQGESGSSQTIQTLTGADLEALNQQLAAATVDRIKAQADAVALAKRRDNIQSVENAAIGRLRERRAQLNGELAALLVRFERDYPPAQALQEQIQSIDRSIGVEQTRIASATAGELESARQRENELRSKVDALIDKLTKEERNGIKYGMLKREVDTNRQLYDALLQRYKEIGIAGVGANNVSIVDTAMPPVAPSSPNLLVNLILSMIVGFALAGVLVLVLENIDQGIRDPSVVEQKLGVPLLGVIPETSADDPLEDVADPKSFVSEAYITVLSNLAFSTDHGVPRLFMLTSTGQAEGKSTSALALAAGLTRAGKKVVVVDADMRIPTIDKRINKRGTDGLSNYLAGDDNLDAMIHPLDFGNLSVLTSGPIPPSAPDLLSGGRMAMLVAELLKRFDHVVIDAPPILGLADTSLIARNVEGVVFIAEAERGAVRAISDAIGRLRTAKARVFGLILTKYSASRSGYGYNYGYSYSYRYGETGENDGEADGRPTRLGQSD